MAEKKIEAPKYPRVIVSGDRHVKLQKEAAKRGISVQELAEEKFKAADKVAKVSGK